MLDGIHPLLSGELLMHLDAMGHSDSVVIADAHFRGSGWLIASSCFQERLRRRSWRRSAPSSRSTTIPRST